MKLTALWILMVFVPPLSAGSATSICTSGAASVPVFDVTSVSGAVGDYTLDCTGGIPTPPLQPVPDVTVYASMTVPVLPGVWTLKDGGTNISGALLSTDVVEFLDVPFNAPGLGGHLDFEVEGIFVNPSLEPPGFEFNESLAIYGDTSIEIGIPQQLVAVNAVPEPSFTLLFAGFGLGAIWLARRLNHSK